MSLRPTMFTVTGLARRHAAIAVLSLVSLLGATMLPSPALAQQAWKIRDTRGHAAIIGGRAAPGASLASLAYIFDYRGPHAAECTGTVVAPLLVLTAAHCTVNDPTGYRVVTGAANRDSPARQISAVSQVIVFPGFDSRSLKHDAALLVLTSATSAPAIPLATRENLGTWPADAEDTIAGWGETHYGQSSAVKRLHWAEMVERPAGVCDRRIADFDPKTQICAAPGPGHGTSECRGDSGGPLLAPSLSGTIQIGIVSYGSPHCSPRRPDVFTRVDAISAWVREVTSSLTPPPSSAIPALEDFPGRYAGHSANSRSIVIDVAADGLAVDKIYAKTSFRCRGGRPRELWARIIPDAGWPIENHLAVIHIALRLRHVFNGGGLLLTVRFDQLGEAQGTLSGQFRSRNRRLGLCYVKGWQFSASIGR
jgi:hypothetical protein